MPWTTPTLRQTRILTKNYVLSQLGAKAMIPNSVLRIMSDAMSGLANLAYLYLDWLSKQLLPDTAENVWLDRHGNIWLVNSDGSKGRKAATYSQGTVEFTNQSGIAGAIIPIGTVLNGSNTVQYQTIEAGADWLRRHWHSQCSVVDTGRCQQPARWRYDVVKPFNPRR